MNEVNSKNFGLLIAYILPGLTTLWSVSYFSVTIRAWFAVTPGDPATVGGFLYVTLASIVAGLSVSTVRWVTIDTLHHWTGIRKPTWDFSKVQSNIGAYVVLVEHKYRYYQFYSNMVVALVLLFVSRRLQFGVLTTQIEWFDAVLFSLVIVFFAASRDTLRQYYSRGNTMLR